ncbi:MAG: hypothetical protein GF403_09020 [Candidatus Coatesbacteria bacterium]|nr:hypothetical protein [Candidatus Coatesbacteria bacterium]
MKRSIEMLPKALDLLEAEKEIIFDQNGNNISSPGKNAAWLTDYMQLLPELLNSIWSRQFQQPPELFPQRLVLFRNLVDYCIDRDIRIVAALTPYAPEYTEFLNDFTYYPEWIAALEAVLDEYSSSSFTWYNLLDVSIFNGRAADFIDYNHMNDANSRRFLEWLMAQTHRR